MAEHFSFTSSPEGLLMAWEHTLSLRASGFKTRLAQRVWTSLGFQVVTVIAEQPKKLSRAERGCSAR